METKTERLKLNRIILIAIIFSLFFSGSVISQDIIEMKKDESGVYIIPCEVNGLKLRFIFDTGASAVSISLTEASFMLKNGYLEDSDITGTTNVQTADGKIAENYVINLKELKIGSVILNNVKAVVSSGLDAPLLLGQSVLDKLGHWSFNNSSLILNDYSTVNNENKYTWEQLQQMLSGEKRNVALNMLSQLVNDGDDQAAYLYLSHIATQEEASRNLLNNPIIAKAMSVLAESKSNSVDDLYWNYEKLIWFCLYRLNDSDIALNYFHNVETKNILPTEDCDKLADKIILAKVWHLASNIDDNMANDYLNKGYYKAYTTYATSLMEINDDPSKSYLAYKRCSDKGYIPASIKLGLCYLNGIGTPVNNKSGLMLLDKSAQAGYVEAITELCSRYYYGDGVIQNFDKCIEYARLYGHEKGCHFLNKAYTGIAYWGKKDYKRAVQELNFIDVFWDEREKAGMMDMAAAFNNGINIIFDEIVCALGTAYEKGLGCKLDFEKAFKYYTKLSESNPAWGYGMLGDMFFLNELIEPDAEMAYKYYVLGANNDSGYCCFRLALMNYYGVGTLKNVTKAKEHKAKAIKLGFNEADFNF